MQLCFSPSNTLYLYHKLINYSLLLVVILILLRVSLGVNLNKQHSVSPRTWEKTLPFESVTIDRNAFTLIVCLSFCPKCFHKSSRLTLNTQHDINSNLSWETPHALIIKCGFAKIQCITPAAQTLGSQTFMRPSKVQRFNKTLKIQFSIMPQLISSTSEKW